MPIEFDYSHVHHLLHAMNRDNRLFHFVRGPPEQVRATMLDILVNRRLVGGNGFIRGGFTCVCAGELPLAQLSQYLADPNALDQEYRALGVIFDKHWFFRLGGRPVIYQPVAEYDLLHDRMKHLHMPYDPDAEYDFSWIREWRIRADELPLDLGNALAVFPNRAWKRELLAEAAARGADLADWESLALTDVGLPVLDN